MTRQGLRIRHPQNLLFGLFLLALGASGIVFVRDLDMGSAVNMGPAYLPTILSGCIVAMGIGFVVSGLAVDGPAWQLFGALGYLFVKMGAEPAPLILGFVLGPLLEENLRRALVFSRGDPMTFVESPISAAFLALSVALLVLVAVPSLRRQRYEAFRDD